HSTPTASFQKTPATAGSDAAESQWSSNAAPDCAVGCPNHQAWPQTPSLPASQTPHWTSPTRREESALHHLNVAPHTTMRSEEHTSELQSRFDLVCRLL